MSDDNGDPFEKLEEDVEDREGDPFETLTADSDDEDEGTADSDPLADEGSGDEGERMGGVAESDQQDGTAETDTAATDDPAHQSGSSDETTVTGQASPDPLGGPGEGFETEMTEGAGPESGQHESESDDQSADNLEASGTNGMDFGVGRDAEGSPDVATDAFDDMGQRKGDPFEGADSAFEEMDVESLDPDQVWEGLESAEARGSVGDASERTYAEVSKHSFCEQCEYFSEPPNVSCAHEGTEIVEFLDMETVRVVDCPIVADRRELEQEE